MWFSDGSHEDMTKAIVTCAIFSTGVLKRVKLALKNSLRKT